MTIFTDTSKSKKGENIHVTFSLSQIGHTEVLTTQKGRRNLELITFVSWIITTHKIHEALIFYKARSMQLIIFISMLIYMNWLAKHTLHDKSMCSQTVDDMTDLGVLVDDINIYLSGGLIWVVDTNYVVVINITI